MSKLDYSNKISFEKKGCKTPELLFRQKVREIEAATQNYVIGNIEEYDGEIESYHQLNALATLTQSLRVSTVHKDIQDELGEIGDKSYKFEFYLSSPKLEDYKFRVLFFEYGISGYPLKIVLEQGIADELFQKEDMNYTITIDTEDALNSLIMQILNTKRIIDILQKIIDASKIIETNIM